LLTFQRRFAASIIRAASTSETSVDLYQATRRNNPGDSQDAAVAVLKAEMMMFIARMELEV
jgi:hypothetical protein